MTRPEEGAFRPFEYPLLIRESHLDTFGHVNNAKYLEIFEEARWELITANGFGKKEIEATGLGPVIVKVTLEFKREVRNRERVTVRSVCLDYPGLLGRIEQCMLREDGQLACRGEFLFGLWDLSRRRLVSPTPQWLKAVGHREP
jgi:thioesterase III